MAKYWTGLNPQEEAAEAFEILSHDAFAADPTNYNRPGFNKNLVLDIEHIPSNQLVKFKALIKEF